MVQHSNCAIIKPANNFALYDDTAKLAGSNGAKAIERRKCILIANSHRYCPWVI